LLEAEVRAKTSSKPKLIPRPQGQAGRSKNGYNLQAEMQLSSDSERFQRLSVSGLGFAHFLLDISQYIISASCQVIYK
jgi:hypothetical protein